MFLMVLKFLRINIKSSLKSHKDLIFVNSAFKKAYFLIKLLKFNKIQSTNDYCSDRHRK